MSPQKRPFHLIACLLVGLGLMLSACELPLAGGAPQASPTPESEASGSDASPAPTPTPSTGHVQPVITF
jgi:hypothetical protein